MLQRTVIRVLAQMTLLYRYGNRTQLLHKRSLGIGSAFHLLVLKAFFVLDT